MAEDLIEPDVCIICEKPTDIKWETYPESQREDIPMCEKCQNFTGFFEVTEAVKNFKDKRDDIDIGRTIAKILKEKGYKHYRGQDVQGVETRSFIKDERLVQVIVEEMPDDETLEGITGESMCD